MNYTRGWPFGIEIDTQSCQGMYGKRDSGQKIML